MPTIRITQPQLLTFTYKTLYCYFMDLSSPFINQRLTKLCPPKLFGLWNLKLFITKQITTNQVAALAGYFLQRKLQLLQNWNVSWYELHYAALAQQIAARCKEGKFCIKSTFRNFWHVLSGSGWPGSATVPRWPLVHSTKRKSRRVQVWSKKRCCLISPTDCLRGSCQPAGCSWGGVGLLSLSCFLNIFFHFSPTFFNFNKNFKKYTCNEFDPKMFSYHYRTLRHIGNKTDTTYNENSFTQRSD